MTPHPYADAVTFDAARILHHAPEYRANRDPIIWAMGVHLLNRPWRMTQWPLTPDVIAHGPRGTGIGLKSRKWYYCTPGDGWDLREMRPDPVETAKPHVLLRGSWEEICTALDRERIGDTLAAEIVRAVEWGEEIAAYFDWERRTGRRTFDDAQRRELAEMDQARQDLNRLERDLAARAWDACRPRGAGPHTPVLVAGGATPRPKRGPKVVARGQIALFE